jgi:GMP synthase (glutamine-hydrolysing)
MDKILILDFGGQYNLLIARRVRAQQVYAEIKSYNAVTADDITSAGYKGIIFTGGPNSVYDETSPHIDKKVLELGIPVLGICYGHQLMAYTAGGAVAPSNAGSEYGKALLYAEDCPLLEKVPSESICWMSHTDSVSVLPQGFRAVAHTDKCQRLLHIVKGLLEPVQTAYPAKGEMFTFCEAVGGGEVFKKIGRVPATIGK